MPTQEQLIVNAIKSDIAHLTFQIQNLLLRIRVLEVKLAEKEKVS